MRSNQVFVSRRARLTAVETKNSARHIIGRRIRFITAVARGPEGWTP